MAVVEVKFRVFPTQTGELLLAVAVGTAFTVTATAAESLLQPAEVVTITL